MLNPHYILLTPANFNEIVYWTHAEYDALEVDYEDSLNEGMNYYVVFERQGTTGLPLWTVYTEVELAVEYRMERIDPASHKRFTRF